jgi:hypothetical protein
MSDFIRKYGELRDECVKYITDFLKENGGRFEFATTDEIESEDFTEFAWQLPQATYIGKHEYTTFYAITSITLENDNLWFNGVSIGEDSDDYNFGVTEMDVAGLCDCSDLLTSKNN